MLLMCQHWTIASRSAYCPGGHIWFSSDLKYPSSPYNHNWLWNVCNWHPTAEQIEGWFDFNTHLNMLEVSFSSAGLKRLPGSERTWLSSYSGLRQNLNVTVLVSLCWYSRAGTIMWSVKRVRWFGVYLYVGCISDVSHGGPSARLFSLRHEMLAKNSELVLRWLLHFHG